jgi:hypothetical protein
MASPRGVLLKISPNGMRRSLKRCAVHAVPHFLAEAQAECGPFEESGAAIALSELIDDAMEIANLARQRVETILASPGPLPASVQARERAKQPGRTRVMSRKKPGRAACNEDRHARPETG